VFRIAVLLCLIIRFSTSMIPTRSDIQSKIDEIRKDPNFSTLRSEVIEKISVWLDSLKLKPVIRFGEEIDPKQMILDDLDTYEF
jgi:hypothetical protein